MAKTNEILYSIIEQTTGKIPSNDTRLEERFVLHQMNIIREKLIEDAFNKGKIDESYYQLKCCIDVTCDRITCGGFDSGDKAWFALIPKLIEGVGFANITYFGNTEFNKYKMGLHSNWDRYSFNGWLAVEYEEYIGTRPAYAVIGGYKDDSTTIDGNVALLKNLPTSGLKKVCVLGLFSNPEEGLCDTDDIMALEYPIPGHMIAKLELLAIKQILSTEVSIGDEANDARDDTSNVKKANVQMNNPEDYENRAN